MSEKFERFTCWTDRTAGEAGFHTLGSKETVDDAMVLATKVNIPINPHGSGEIIDIQNLIDRFIGTFDVEVENTIYAITGDSGSGKTFLIRCLQTQVDKDPRAHVVYVPRDITSLHGILKLILSELPGEAAMHALREVESSNFEELEIELLLQLVHAQIRVEIAQGHGLSLLQEDDSLTAKEKTALQYLYGTKSGEIYRLGLSDYLAHPDVMNHLIRENGILWNHVKAMRGESLEDETGPIAKSEILIVPQARKKMPGLDEFLFYLDGNESLVAKIIETVRDASLGAQVKISRNLTQIVEDARQILDSLGKQLVLMFEDIARNGVGLSDAVFDMFRPAGGKSLKPIRVIFAATGGYWPQIPVSVSRSCRRFEVRNLTTTDPKTYGIGLEIIAKYLNVARLGKQSVMEAWNQASTNERSTGSWIPNKCDDCSFKRECHEEFGSVGKVGLYPLNEIAAKNVLLRLEELNTNPGFSPRLIVRVLISEWLRDSWAPMNQNKFPTGQIEELVGPRASTDLVDLAFENEVNDVNRPMIERIHRARIVWANFDQTNQTYSKALAFAFGLEDFGEEKRGVEVKQTSEQRDGEIVKPLPTSSVVEKWFPAEYLEIAEWATKVSKPLLAPALVEDLRRFLRRLVSQSLRLDRHLIDSSSPEIKHLLDTYLGDDSIRIEDGKGDENHGQRIQRRIERSNDSYRLLLAALWFMKTGSWDTTYQEGLVLWKCDPAICVRGRLILMNWTDEFAKEIIDRSRQAIDDASEATIRAQVRLLSLQDSTFLESKVDDSISKLTALRETLKVLEPITNDGPIQELLNDFDSYIAGSVTAFQEDGSRRLAEDLVIKEKVLREFRENPEWRSRITLRDQDCMIAMNEKVGNFSVEIASFLEMGEISVREFKEKIGEINFVEFESQLMEFRLIFESLVSLKQTTKQPQDVRSIIENLREGLLPLVDEKDALLESVENIEKLSDPEIWRIIQRFPFLSNWTQNYKGLMELASEILDDLNERIGHRPVADVQALRSGLNACLDSVQVPDDGLTK
jgi:hypothetical protein